MLEEKTTGSIALEPTSFEARHQVIESCPNDKPPVSSDNRIVELQNRQMEQALRGKAIGEFLEIGPGTRAVKAVDSPSFYVASTLLTDHCLKEDFIFLS